MNLAAKLYILAVYSMLIKKIFADKRNYQCNLIGKLNFAFNNSDIILSYSDKVITLSNALNNGETTDTNYFYLFYNDDINAIFIFGGPLAYIISLENANTVSIKTERTIDLAEYWMEEIIFISKLICIIYESGVLVLSENFHLIKNEFKYIDERLNFISHNQISLIDDNDITRILLV